MSRQYFRRVELAKQALDSLDPEVVKHQRKVMEQEEWERRNVKRTPHKFSRAKMIRTGDPRHDRKVLRDQLNAVSAKGTLEPLRSDYMWFRWVRRQLGLKPKDIAAGLDCTTSYICAVETGNAPPSAPFVAFYWNLFKRIK